MPRRFKSEKPFIEVFCEGKSEQAYVSFLKKKFADVAVINCPIGNPATTYYYDYFNVTDAYLSKDHTRDALSAKLPAAYGTQYSFGTYFGGTEYGSDFTGLDYSATMPSDFNIVPAQTQPVQTTTTTPVQTQPAQTTPAYTTPAYTTPAYTTPPYTISDHTIPEYTEPDDDYSYIDEWSDDDWDNYWNDMDDWIDSNGYDEYCR